MCRLASILGLVVLSGCVGTTGGDLFTFEATAVGPLDAARSPNADAFRFTSGRGYDVTLESASVFVGAVYLSQGRPSSGAQATSCLLPSTDYIAEVTSGFADDAGAPVMMNVLAPGSQPFSGVGEGIERRAVMAEVWLSDGDVNAEDSNLPVLTVAGSAEKNGVHYRFSGEFTIGQNRSISGTPAMPSENAICKQRVVTGIPVNLTPTRGGRLTLRIKPEVWFANVDFAQFPGTSIGATGGTYVFRDTNGADQPSNNLYLGLHATAAYELTWAQ